MPVSQAHTQFWWGCPVPSDCQVRDLILSYLQGNKLANWCLTDAGRRHKTPEWEKKNYSKKSMSIRMSVSIPLVSKLHTGDMGAPERGHTYSGSVLQLENSKPGEPTAFPASTKLSLLFVPEGDKNFISQDCPLQTQSWEMVWVEWVAECLRCCLLLFSC